MAARVSACTSKESRQHAGLAQTAQTLQAQCRDPSFPLPCKPAVPAGLAQPALALQAQCSDIRSPCPASLQYLQALLNPPSLCRHSAGIFHSPCPASMQHLQALLNPPLLCRHSAGILPLALQVRKPCRPCSTLPCFAGTVQGSSPLPCKPAVPAGLAQYALALQAQCRDPPPCPASLQSLQVLLNPPSLCRHSAGIFPPALLA